MAKLKILVSSTCYDFSIVRDELREFIRGMGHDSVMSDHDDILFDPRDHTHASCISAVEDCHMIILIIGGRFGGKCVPSALENINIELLKAKSKNSVFLGNVEDKKLSITQAEILKATELSIPIYTFVLNNVYSDHNHYQNNKSNTSSTYPSIDDNKHATYIFEFINFIRHRNENNSIKPFSSLSDIKEYLKGQWSQLFQKLLTEDNNAKANIRIVDGTEGYLTLLAEIIEKSNREVLFTSTKMADTNAEPPYGELQNIIIKKSLEFKKRNSKRLHYGIIDAGSPETSAGAAELRLKVPDIVLRFNNELNSIKVNFLISDEEFVVLRMNKGGGNDRYSALIQNKHLAIILKRYFYALWGKSEFMNKHFKGVVRDENNLEDILESSGYKNSIELLEFLNSLHAIDENHQSVPSKFIDKVIHVNNSYFENKETDALNKYKKYFHESINKAGINLSKINEIRRKILGNKPIMYENSAHTFFVQYFLSNYFKARHSLECLTKSLDKNTAIKILDIGGGGGASSLAIIDYVSKEGFIIDKFDIVDRSEEQLSITKNIIEVNGTSTNFIKDDAYAYLKLGAMDYDFIFAGNFLCEANKQVTNECLPTLLKEALSDNGKLLVVERAESKVYESIEESKCFRLNNYMYQNFRFKIPTDNTFFEFVDDADNIRISDFIKKEYTLRYALYE